METLKAFDAAGQLGALEERTRGLNDRLNRLEDHIRDNFAGFNVKLDIIRDQIAENKGAGRGIGSFLHYLATAVALALSALAGVHSGGGQH